MTRTVGVNLCACCSVVADDDFVWAAAWPSLIDDFVDWYKRSCS